MLNYDWKATCIRTPRTKTDEFAQFVMTQWIVHGVKVPLFFNKKITGNKLLGRVSNLKIYQRSLNDKEMKIA